MFAMKLLLYLVIFFSFYSKAQEDTSFTQIDIPPPNLSLPVPIGTRVELEAQYPGGVQALKKFISDNVIYPQEAIEKGFSEKVYLQAIVTETGALDSIEILRGTYDLLNQEALRVMHKMPNWEKMTWKGKPVRQRIRLPIKFSATGSEVVSSGTPELIDSLDIDGNISARYVGGESKLQEDLNEIQRFDINENTEFDTFKVEIKVDSSSTFVSSKVLSADNRRDYELKNLLRELKMYSAKLENNKPIMSSITYQLLLPKDSIEYYRVVNFPDEVATFPGGELERKKFIGNVTSYTKEALNNRESGKVYVEFIVTKNGMIADARVIRSISPLLDAESLRVVNLMPRWVPATLKGENVASRVRFPISYHFR